ncbi:MAG: hypothetical protein COT18_07705 [Elusimicrobia bacterium CG08_land_8_20_14_0_20_59_10]|nr:MAG: hypothetical protein COT18_07705 [Elusimicrobia bacterium CG08_land_8_20_14_0_20_59_10]
MAIDFDNFARVSTLVHSIQGASLLLLGAAEAYLIKKPGHKAGLAGPFALILGGGACICVILALLGGWSFDGLAQALAARKGFYIFIASSCLFAAAGLSRLMQHAAGERGRSWQVVFLLLMAMTGVLYLMTAGRVNEEVFRQVMIPHSFMGGALLLGVLARAGQLFFGRKALHLAWVALLTVASFQLLAYRENPGSFGVRTVTLELPPGLPAATGLILPVQNPNNAPPAAEKRTDN